MTDNVFWIVSIVAGLSLMANVYLLIGSTVVAARLQAGRGQVREDSNRIVQTHGIQLSEADFIALVRGEWVRLGIVRVQLDPALQIDRMAILLTDVAFDKAGIKPGISDRAAS